MSTHAKSPISPRDRVIFFPTAASPNADGTWDVPIHGWIFRPAESSRLRRTALGAAAGLLRKKLSREDVAAMFRQRFGAFLADNARGHRVQIELEGAVHTLKRSRPNGHCQSMLRIDIRNPMKPLCFCAALREGDDRRFEGRVHCLPEEGLSVISDIDDTIKLTHVLSRRKMLRSTFLSEFESVPEMAAVYQRWERERGAAFHYISASPWHLYPFLAEFLAHHNFPAGTFHLRDMRLMPRDLPRTLRPGRRSKLRHARELFRRFPKRRFVLVGDSGESDATIYAKLACEFPKQVERIYIREVDEKTTAKAKRLGERLPTGLMTFFRKAGEIGG